MAANVEVGILMGSDSDLGTMQDAAEALNEFGIGYEMRVISAHRTPDILAEYAASARKRGLKTIIAGAGGAAHLPGVVAAYTTLPVIGVPIQTRALGGVDSLYSIVQMPAGVPVATVAIGNGRNAGILAAQIIAVGNRGLQTKLERFKRALAKASIKKNDSLPKH